MSNFWEMVWTFVNSPIGVSIVTCLVAYGLGKFWKVKPGWERLFDRHRGIFFDAIRYAEEETRSAAAGSSQEKANLALGYLLEIEKTLDSYSINTLTQGIERALELWRAKGKKGEGE